MAKRIPLTLEMFLADYARMAAPRPPGVVTVCGGLYEVADIQYVPARERFRVRCEVPRGGSFSAHLCGEQTITIESAGESRPQ